MPNIMSGIVIKLPVTVYRLWDAKPNAENLVLRGSDTIDWPARGIPLFMVVINCNRHQLVRVMHEPEN
jgi:hypothetical protein